MHGGQKNIRIWVVCYVCVLGIFCSITKRRVLLNFFLHHELSCLSFSSLNASLNSSPLDARYT